MTSGIGTGLKPVQTTVMRTRGKRYDNVKTNKTSLVFNPDELKKNKERQKMIRRSNERLKLLDEMGQQRKVKLKEDLMRLELEKQAEIKR